MMKLLIINVTQHTPQIKVSDTITHVTLNTTNGGVCWKWSIRLLVVIDI